MTMTKEFVMTPAIQWLEDNMELFRPMSAGCHRNMFDIFDDVSCWCAGTYELQQWRIDDAEREGVPVEHDFDSAMNTASGDSYKFRDEEIRYDVEDYNDHVAYCTEQSPLLRSFAQ